MNVNLVSRLHFSALARGAADAYAHGKNGGEDEKRTADFKKMAASALDSTIDAFVVKHQDAEWHQGQNVELYPVAENTLGSILYYVAARVNGKHAQVSEARKTAELSEFAHGDKFLLKIAKEAAEIGRGKKVFVNPFDGTH